MLTEIAYAAISGQRQPGGWWKHETADIASGTIVFPGAYIGPLVTIGDRCVIGPGSAIGAPGFGYTLEEDGTWAYRSHESGVIIHDDVRIGSNTCVDQGRWRATVIREGARIDNHVHVGHNCIVGRNCLLIAHVMLGGSSEIGDGARIAPGAQIREGLQIGVGSVVGMGAIVLENVPPGEVWVGNPARHLRRQTNQELQDRVQMKRAQQGFV